MRRSSRLLHVASVVGVIALIAATSAFGAGGGWHKATAGEEASFRHKPKQASGASAFILPPTKKCLSGRTLTLQLRKLPHVTWAHATVTVNGERVKTIERPHLTQPVLLKSLPVGRVALAITAVPSHGRSVSATRVYRTCAVKRPKPTKPVPPPTKPADPPPVVSSPPEPGSYKAHTTGYDFSFYVSPDGSQLQDVSIAGLGVRCAPGNGTFGTQFYVPQIAIGADGSFSATVTEEGDVAGFIAQFSYTFSGHFHGYDSSGRARIAGALRENVTYDNGASRSCTSNVLPWSAIRDTQPSQAPSSPEPGSYTAHATGYDFSFDVSSDGTHLQGISIAGLGVRCAPGNGTFGILFHLSEVAIDGDGSFAATVTEAGVVSGHPAEFTYAFSGHLHGHSQSGLARIAGALRADVTYDDGTSRSCTSNILPWSATS